MHRKNMRCHDLIEMTAAERDKLWKRIGSVEGSKVKTARVQAQAQVQAAQASVLESGLDVELPPGGPGSSWGDPNVVW
jgi:hypothetical protein